MKKLLLVAALTIMTVGVGPLAAQAPATVEGQLVDGRCYLLNSKYAGAAANNHDAKKGCGQMCLDMGIPGAVLTKDGKYVPIIGASLSMSEFVGETIRVTGKMKDSAILADKVEVNKGGTWTAVKMATMM